MKKIRVCLLFTLYLLASNCTAQSDKGSTVPKKYLITGITLSCLGGAAIAFSIPCYISAARANPKHASVDLSGAFGSAALGAGCILEGLSIPFYIKHRNLKKQMAAKVAISDHGINMIIGF